MAKEDLPKHYRSQKRERREFMDAVESLGRAVRTQGPIDDKMADLIQLAAAVAIHSEGSVHSHVRRAIEHGATPEEIHHAIILLTSTIGFPTVSAALSWAEDILK